MNTILITGSAGFIGMHLVLELLKYDYRVIGIDNLNDYYDVKLKEERLKNCGVSNIKNILENIDGSDCIKEKYFFYKMDIKNSYELKLLFQKYTFDIVIHLAAQAGVRYSIKNPKSYIDNNLTGFFNVLEASREYKVKRFLYASSSSVYGNANDVPFNENQFVDKPISLYAATKKSNELIAHSYAEIYKMNVIGMRFFTVYGPYGRPDMAYFSFAENIINNKSIKVYNHGYLSRDFTFIDDIISGISLLISKPTAKENLYEIYNLANSSPINLLKFIETLENALGKKAIKEFADMQPGDVNTTYADISKMSALGYLPNTEIKFGIGKFVEWFKNYR